jgi:hypothetical protein
MNNTNKNKMSFKDNTKERKKNQLENERKTSSKVARRFH